MLKRMLSHGRAFEEEFVHNTYENIAGHFSNTRYKPWPKVDSFLNSLPPHSLVLDIGCGNGKYLHSNPLTRIGLDVTQNLLEICSSRNLNVFRGNCLSLPIKSNSFDAAISIAVIHHMSTDERRLSALQEMLRILHLGGLGLVYVWAKEQSEGKRKFEEQDVFVPWKSNVQGGDTFQRFYHVFVEGELEGLVRQVAKDGYKFDVIESYFDCSNWCVVLRKARIDN
jgi:SAM-dependent methyltransferase